MDSAVASALERPTLSAQVARHILNLVTRERLRPGDRVPSEVQIGRDLQVSRGSVREAYRTLAALGILEIESGRRPRLRPACPDALWQIVEYALNTAQAGLAHVSEIRRAIELQSAQMAARRANETQRRKLRELASQMRAAAMDQALRLASDAAIHIAIAEASGNPLNVLFLSALRRPPGTCVPLHPENGGDEDESTRLIEAHEAIVERICAGDPEGAARAMSDHFDLSLLKS
jgi:GntR family transcriptional repressor for pyruvate dehydrogenase complex